eukprot:scaffold1583_cov299-Pinguiococcus_pyrenoidosus.AAC.7
MNDQLDRNGGHNWFPPMDIFVPRSHPMTQSKSFPPDFHRLLVREIRPFSKSTIASKRAEIPSKGPKSLFSRYPFSRHSAPETLSLALFATPKPAETEGPGVKNVFHSVKGGASEPAEPSPLGACFTQPLCSVRQGPATSKSRPGQKAGTEVHVKNRLKRHGSTRQQAGEKHAQEHWRAERWLGRARWRRCGRGEDGDSAA